MIGPVISQAAVRSINEQIKDALDKGAIDATPANLTFQNPPKDGNYVAPRLLTNVNHTMQVMQQETFGPVIPVMKVVSDEEAIALMNDSDYGLTASVWTNDLEKGEELLPQLEAGTVFINRCDHPHPVSVLNPKCAYLGVPLAKCVNKDLAWTGWKNSGLGCTLGPRGFDAFVKLQSYHVKQNQG